MEYGKIVWTDLTVSNAEQIRDFYSSVVGWSYNNHPMGEYNDYEMKTSATEEVVTGICHAQGTNANMPPVWIIYVTVQSIAHSLEQCLKNGGRVVDGPRTMGKAQFAVIQDPAGAMLGLIESE